MIKLKKKRGRFRLAWTDLDYIEWSFEKVGWGYRRTSANNWEIKLGVLKVSRTQLPF